MESSNLDVYIERLKNNISASGSSASDLGMTVEDVDDMVNGGFRGISGLQQGLQEDMTGFNSVKVGSHTNVIPNPWIVGE